jgi:hypothetical protein
VAGVLAIMLMQEKKRAERMKRSVGIFSFSG